MKNLFVFLSFVILSISLASCVAQQDKKEHDAWLKEEAAIEAQQQQQANQIAKQLTPYKIEDLSNLKDVVIGEISGRSLSSDGVTCNKKSISSLSGLAYCSSRGNDTSNYIIINDRDVDFWTVLQVLPTKGILVSYDEDYDSPSTIIMIEGKFPNVVDGQSFSKHHYLLKRAGTFTYKNTLGSTSTIVKLKLVKELTWY